MLTLDELLSHPPSRANAQAILDYVRELRGRVVRGDMVVGILGMDEMEQVPAALERAAAQGEAVAWLELARWHAHPPSGKRDPAGMERALRRAREEHVPGAERELVRLRWFYRRDDSSADEQREAFDVARALVEGSPGDDVALYDLGLLTYQGFGAPADPARAAVLQRAAADLGNADAMFELYAYHEAGVGVPRDPDVAFQWVRKAAEAGHSRAMYNMGACCATGRHVPLDPAAAVRWYERASDLGNVGATAMLGAMYARGEGVEPDRDLARQLLDEADYMGFDTSRIRAIVGLPRASTVDRPTDD